MIEIKVPELAESITEGTISKWLKNVGDQVNVGDDIVELETDKVNIEVSAESAGVLQELKKEEGDDVEVGEVIAVLGENGEAGGSAGGNEQPAEDKKEEQPAEASKDAAPEKDTKTEVADDQSGKEDNGGRPAASPAARKRARELGIDLNDVQTKDPLGRVRTEDIERAASQPKSSDSGAPKQQPKAQEPAQDPEKPVEVTKMSRRRRTIANKMLEVTQNTAMLTTFNEVDMTAIMDLRKRRKDSFLKNHGVRLGFMSFFTKAVVGALKKFPLLNAEIQGENLVVKKFYDIGIAVAADEGLVVPIVRNADRMSFAEIEREIGNLAGKARDNSLSLKELQGGSFTITNGGVFGSLYSTPILNSPQVGILGMHTIQKRPIAVEDDKIEVRPMMYIALSYDHRIVDGSEAVSFLVQIKQMLEDPENLLLEG